MQTTLPRDAMPVTDAGWLARRPAIVLVIVAQLFVGLFAAALLAALAMPQFGASARRSGSDIQLRLRNGQAWLLPETAPVTIAGGGERVVLPAASLLNDAVPHGGPASVRAFYAAHDEIRRLAGTADAAISAAGERPVALSLRPRRVRDLPVDFWLLSLQAMVIGLLGVWMRSHAGASAGAWWFGLSCDGIFIAGLSGAVFDARELTANGALLQAMQGANFIGSQLAAASLLAMFLAAPRPLASHWVSGGVVLLAPVMGALQGSGHLPLASFYWFLLATTLAAFPVCLLQYRRAADDPRSRSVLRWIGATTVAGSALVTGGMAAPVLLGIAPLASDGMTILPMALVYGGIAFGIGNARMFELERWTVRVAAGGFAALALFAVDAMLVGLLRLDQPVALALALFAVGYVWMPLRARLWQAIVGGRPQSPEELFRQAAQVAFLDDDGERRRAWHRLLDRVFEPAEIAPLPQAPAAPMLVQDGLALLLPALAGEGGLRLSRARRGAGLFGQAALGTARELSSLIATAEEARAAYVRGVQEERRRIARDLHDDVSALLLTALHRPRFDDARSDVNRALAEVRVMASSLAGRSQTLDVVLGDSRYEAASRLAAAGIELDWPAASDLPGEDCLLGYACHKALTSALREILTNVIRHSGAGKVAVRAALVDGTLRLSVADDGRGLAEGDAVRPSGGNGLPNLAHRLQEFGGECLLESGQSGLTVGLVLPIAGSRAPL